MNQAERPAPVSTSMLNSRFFGVWLLDSVQTVLADGTVLKPWGADPVGIFYWDQTGYFAVQVGPRDSNSSGTYTSFFGQAQAPDGEAGTLRLKVVGSSNSAVGSEQVREFFFVGPGILRMRPPVSPDGAQSTLFWRKAPAG